jgi:hypothetical protein
VGGPRRLRLLHLQLGPDLDSALKAARDGAESSVQAVDTLGLGSLLPGDREPVADGDPLDHEHLVVDVDVADGLDLVALRIDVDVTRFQRAGKGARQSAASGGHDVIERRRVGREVLLTNAVVVGDLRVHAELDGLGLGGEVCEPPRTSYALDAHARDVGRLTAHAVSVLLGRWARSSSSADGDALHVGPESTADGVAISRAIDRVKPSEERASKNGRS